MHPKNKRTVHKEVKRLAHKSSRAKTKDAIDGNTPNVAHSESWSNSIPQPPIVNEVGRHKKSAKKVTPSKEKCSINGTHEWAKEWKTIQKVHIRPRHGFWGCQECLSGQRNFYKQWYCNKHSRETLYEVYTRVDTCVHCEKERIIKSKKNRIPYRISRARAAPKPRTAYRKNKDNPL